MNFFFFLYLKLGLAQGFHHYLLTTFQTLPTNAIGISLWQISLGNNSGNKKKRKARPGRPTIPYLQFQQVKQL